MSSVRALIIASHPGPTLAISAMATLLAGHWPDQGTCGADRSFHRGSRRVPFVAAMCVAAVDVVLFAAGGDALT
jgi:hypothetical protein